MKTVSLGQLSPFRCTSQLFGGLGTVRLNGAGVFTERILTPLKQPKCWSTNLGKLTKPPSRSPLNDDFILVFWESTQKKCPEHVEQFLPRYLPYIESLGLWNQPLLSRRKRGGFSCCDTLLSHTCSMWFFRDDKLPKSYVCGIMSSTSIRIPINQAV